MSAFSCSSEVQDGALVVAFSGPIDENTKFPELNISDVNKVHLNLNEVSYINSIGIKGWIQWILPLSEQKPFEFSNCPKSIIFQINMVKNFLPKNAKVVSFYLPLFSEDIDQEASVLLDVSKDLDLTSGSVKILADYQTLANASAGEEGEWEIDVIEKKYFRFLQGPLA